MRIFDEPKVPRQASAAPIVQAIKRMFEPMVRKPLAKMTDEEIINSIMAPSEAELQHWIANHTNGYKGFYTDDIVQANKDLRAWAQKEHGRELIPAEVNLYHLVSAFGSDLEDTMNILRWDKVRPKQLERVGKYHRSWFKLTMRTAGQQSADFNKGCGC